MTDQDGRSWSFIIINRGCLDAGVDALMTCDHQDRQCQPVILSAAKDLRSGRATCLTKEILRCAQDDRGRGLPHRLSKVIIASGSVKTHERPDAINRVPTS